MGLIMRGGDIVRRLGVPRLLLGAALGVFGLLFLGAWGTATAAWAQDETAEAEGLAALTDPLTAEVSDMSRLAARLVPHNQLGQGTSADEGTASGLVSGLTEPVAELTAEPAEIVPLSDAAAGLVNGESVGDSAAGVVTPLVTLADRTVSAAQSPADAVSGVYETVAPATDEVEVVARLVTDGLGTWSDETTPGSVLAHGLGQPSFTALQTDTVPTEVAAALPGVRNDRSAAHFECSAAEIGARGTDEPEAAGRYAPVDGAARHWPPKGPKLPDLNLIPGGATGSSAGISVDGGQSAVDVSPFTAAEQVSLARALAGEVGRPLDRTAELSVAPD
ncbi:hypothetical protein [Glycomyces salinus]|uniref:hypothetical protein n=1 Tax=Glycomyces salinus TaxID=980294 RepID=UPI0018EB6AA7|nr:hypothetical protein [Glycomyces salinus]